MIQNKPIITFLICCIIHITTDMQYNKHVQMPRLRTNRTATFSVDVSFL